MGRPPKGEHARNVAATVKISEVEKRWLTNRYGSPSRGLRAALDQAKKGIAVREKDE